MDEDIGDAKQPESVAAVLKVFEIVKALPADQVFASEAELDAYLARMQQRARESR